MKKLTRFIVTILEILFYISKAEAQPRFFLVDSAYVRTIEDLPTQEPFDTAHQYKMVKEKHLYIISDNDMYHLFGYAIFKKYLDFDFRAYHILGERRCENCDRANYVHPNVCDFKWVWVVRDNKKAFDEVPVTRTLGGRGWKATKEKIKKPMFRDTVALDDPKKDTATWYTSGGGDCFASFEYKIYKDKYRPVLLLKEWNYYGGCRAGGLWDFEVSFLMPAGISYFAKRTILVERNGEKF